MSEQPLANDYEITPQRNEPLIDLLDMELSPEIGEIIAALKLALEDSTFDPEALRQLWLEYSLRFEAFAGTDDENDHYAKAQFGAIIHKALLLRDAARHARYLEELNLAEVDTARVGGFDELNAALTTTLNAELSQLESVPLRLILQLRGRIDQGDQLQLWDIWVETQDYEELVDRAYEMILGYGKEDPDEVLHELGIF